LSGEGGAHVPIPAIWREDLHSRPVRHGDTRLLLVGRAVEDRDVVLTAHGDPDLFAIWREEGLVGRPPDVRDMLHGVGRGIDERDRVRTNRDDGEGTMIWRKAEAVHQQRSSIERSQIRWRRLA